MALVFKTEEKMQHETNEKKKSENYLIFIRYHKTKKSGFKIYITLSYKLTLF